MAFRIEDAELERQRRNRSRISDCDTEDMRYWIDSHINAVRSRGELHHLFRVTVRVKDELIEIDGSVDATATYLKRGNRRQKRLTVWSGLKNEKLKRGEFSRRIED